MLSMLLLGPSTATSAYNFTVYSSPITLRYGEVHNKMLTPLPLPRDVVTRYANDTKKMAITGFEMDIVRRAADGTETSVPLYETYYHHYILHIGEARGLDKLKAESGDRGNWRQSTMHPPKLESGSYVSFGGAAGAEYRHNPHKFQEPFRIVVDRPESWAPTLHMINTRHPTIPFDGTLSPLLQCPCTPQRDIDVAAGTIDGHRPYPPIGCDAQFAATNPSCSLSTYAGGWRCCEDGIFVIDTDKECATPACLEHPKETVYLRTTFHYEDALPSTRAMEAAACCDVTSDDEGNANIEYDIEPCAAGTPPDQCVAVASTVQPLGFFDDRATDGQQMLDLAFAAPHLHVSGISLELQDALTNQTVCKVSRANGGVLYGSSRAPGDESNYLTGLLPCSWSAENAPRFARSHPMRTIAVYNATARQYGVMSLWLMNAAAKVDVARCSKKLRELGCLDEPTTRQCDACAMAHSSDLYSSGCDRDLVKNECSNTAALVEAA